MCLYPFEGVTVLHRKGAWHTFNMPQKQVNERHTCSSSLGQNALVFFFFSPDFGDHWCGNRAVLLDRKCYEICKSFVRSPWRALES